MCFLLFVDGVVSLPFFNGGDLDDGDLVDWGEDTCFVDLEGSFLEYGNEAKVVEVFLLLAVIVNQ